MIEYVNNNTGEIAGRWEDLFKEEGDEVSVVKNMKGKIYETGISFIVDSDGAPVIW